MFVDPFGETVAHTGADFLHRFGTKPYSEELGTYSYIYREYSPGLGRWLSEDPILERGGYNLYSYCGNEPINRYDYWGMYGWTFSLIFWHPTMEKIDFYVAYTMNPEERKCCKRSVVDRYVKKTFLFRGGTIGKYKLDHGGEGSYQIKDKFPFTTFAEDDSPDGPGLFLFDLYRVRWTQSFLWIAKCVEGKNNGMILSTIKKRFQTDGHWSGKPYRARFLEETDEK